MLRPGPQRPRPRRQLHRDGLHAGAGWGVTDGDEVVGFVWSEKGAAGAPLDVVLDGRTLTWDQLGEALSAYEDGTSRC